MKILFVNQFYSPERVATAQILADLCEYLSAAGHDVTVVCSRHQFDEGTAGTIPLPRRERIGGVDVRRVGGSSFGKRHVLGQLADFLSFHLLGGARLLSLAARYDVVVTLTTPPLISLYGTLAKWITGVPHICWVMNLHPDCEFELGMLDRQKLMSRILNRLNSLSLQRADKCVVLGSCMAGRVARKGVSQQRISVIPLWGHDIPLDRRVAQANPLRERWGLNGKFVAMYSGNAGIEYTFDDICAVALRLRDDPRFVFCFTGGGRRWKEIERFRESHQLLNIQMHGYVARDELKDLLTLADVHLVCLRPELAGVSVPCKLYGVMAAARPAIFIGPSDCETAEAVSVTHSGRIFSVGDTDNLLRSLVEFAEDPALCARLGAASRRAFEQTYNVHNSCDQWMQLIASAHPRPAG